MRTTTHALVNHELVEAVRRRCFAKSGSITEAGRNVNIMANVEITSFFNNSRIRPGQSRTARSPRIGSASHKPALPEQFRAGHSPDSGGRRHDAGFESMYKLVFNPNEHE